MIGIEDFPHFTEPDDAHGFIFLGNYLPSGANDVTPYDINTRYGKLGEQFALSDNPFKTPLVFITAGSCFKSSGRQRFYGRVKDDIAMGKVITGETGIEIAESDEDERR